MIVASCLLVFLFCLSRLAQPAAAIIAKSHLYCNLDTAYGKEGVVSIPGAKLRAVVVLARHGDRSAIHHIPDTKKEDWDCGAPSKIQQVWKHFKNFHVVNVRTKESVPAKYYLPAGLNSEHQICEPGKLTKEGFLQHLSLGNHLRRSYSSALELSDKNYTQWFYSRSTNYPRTIQSAIGLVMGLLSGSSTSHARTPVRILVNDQDDDEIMHGVGLTSSSKHSELHPEEPENEHQGSCPEAVRTLRQQLVGFQLNEDLKTELVELFGSKVERLRITDIADQVHARICHSLPLPCNMQGKCMSTNLAVRVADESNRMYCEKYNGDNGGKTASMLSMYPFLSEILKVLQDNANGKSTVRLAVFVGHDTVIAPILSALGVNNCGWPPYASRITFELWEKNDAPSHIRVLFNGQEITRSIQGCNEELCPLTSLAAQVSHGFHPQSFERACQSQKR